MKKTPLLATLLFLSALPLLASANSIISIAQKGDAQPGKPVTVTLSSNIIDLSAADIAWSQNGKIVDSGAGKVSEQVYVPKFGQKTTLTAIATIQGKTYRNDITITPGVIDIIWEAQTAVPPFYRGKAIPSHMSLVRALAIPLVSDLSLTDGLSYSWKGQKSVNLGKIGASNMMQIAGAWEGESFPLSVSANIDGNTVRAQENITSYVPRNYFYEISPTLGVITQRSLQGTIRHDGAELNILAIPFGIANLERARGRVQYDWTTNGKPSRSGMGIDQESILFTRANDPNKAGTVNIGLTAQNAVNVMQRALGAFIWSFTNK